MDLQQRITRRLRADYDATRVNATVTIDAAAKLAALEAEDDTEAGQAKLWLTALENAGDDDGHLPALVLAEPDLQALTAAGLNLPTETDVQGPVTPAGEPAVVVGGRYVVGENPTYRGVTGKSLPLPTDMAGCSVEVTAVDGDTGDVLVRSVMGHEWIDPRHLTPAPEPAAAPAVDDDLLADLGKVVDELHYQANTSWKADGRGLLQSEPMQRYVEIKERQATAKYVEDALRIRDERDAAVRERDEARAELDQLHSWDGLMRLLAEHWPADVFGDGSTFSDQDDPGVQIVNLIQMVSKARAEVERLRAELTATIERWNRAYSEAVKDMAVGWKTDVERLRAAQQLPDLLRQAADRLEANGA